MAKQGEGYVLQPTFIVGEALKKGELVSILDEYIPQSIALYAVYPHRKLISNKLRVFIDFLCNYFEDTPFGIGKRGVYQRHAPQIFNRTS